MPRNKGNGTGAPKTEVFAIGVGDIHFPWANEAAIKRVIKAIRKNQPKYVIQIGDLYDFYCHSKYVRSLNIMTPQDEQLAAVAQAKKFWKQVQKAAPNARCYQILGNHDERMMLRVMERNPEMEYHMKGIKEAMFTFDGVKTVYDVREELDLEGIRYIHGYLTKTGDHAQKNQMPIVAGHSHRGGVVSLFGPGSSDIFELNLGWLGDRHAPVFSYKPQKKMNHWTLGYGIILKHDGKFFPRFIEIPEEEVS